MVFAAIGFNFKSTLLICPVIVNGYQYRRMLLDSNLIDSLNSHFGQNSFLWQQNGAPEHNAKFTFQFLKKE
jgi:hypothetical protein